MNNQSNRTQTTQRASASNGTRTQQTGRAQGTASQRPGAQRRPQPASEYGRRKRPNSTLLSFLRKGMYVLMAGIALTGLLLIVLPMFRVSNIEVTGNVRYETDDILNAAQLAVDQELLAVPSDDEIRSRIFDWDTNRYIQSIGIERRFGSISITITEAQNLMYTEQNGVYYVLDATLRMMYTTTDASEISDYTKVKLPVGATFEAGKKVSFPFGTADTAYIEELLCELDARGIRESVTEIDFSKKFSVSYVLENACRVKIGKVGNMDTKFALVEEILSRRAVDFQTLSVVDVSNTGNPTFRMLSGDDTLMNR